MKLKVKSKAKLVLFITLLALLVSMVGTSFVQSNFGQTKVTTYTGTLNDLATMITNNTAANGKKVDIQFTKDKTSQFCFMLFQPSTATKENPAPAIILSHGNFNSKELQLMNYVELARRGFVVISIDNSSHGRTDTAINALTANSYGMLAATEYAMSLDYVDNSKIGVGGHSAGQSACYATIAAINKASSSNHIAAWFESSGTMPARINMKQENATDLIWGISAGKYDEADYALFNTIHFLDNPLLKTLIKWDFPGYNLSTVPEGHWFTSKGDVGAPAEGTALGVNQAIVVWNPAYTHPSGTFNTTAAELTIKFFYAAFGTPKGATMLPSTNQIWYIGVAFETLGLIAFFGMMLPLVSVLLETPLFAGLKKPERVRKDLTSVKSWKEWLPLSVTLLALMLFAYLTYYPYYGAATALFDATAYPISVGNAIGWWTLCSGLFALAMICVNYGMKKLIHRKDKEAIANPFEPARLDSISHFLKTLLFVATVVFIMYIPCFIAYYVFQADFRIATFAIGLPQMKWLPDMSVKYLPMWIVFFVPNAILNANTRFNDLPEWATKTLCAVANTLPIIILMCIEYGTLFTTGALWNSSSMPGILGFAFVPPMVFVAFSARYIYKRTGNAWLGGLLNATIMCFITITVTSHGAAYMFHF